MLNELLQVAIQATAAVKNPARCIVALTLRRTAAREVPAIVCVVSHSTQQQVSTECVHPHVCLYA